VKRFEKIEKNQEKRIKNQKWIEGQVK
jgi:hypothetical protein